MRNILIIAAISLASCSKKDSAPPDLNQYVVTITNLTIDNVPVDNGSGFTKKWQSNITIDKNMDAVGYIALQWDVYNASNVMTGSLIDTLVISVGKQGLISHASKHNFTNGFTAKNAYIYKAWSTDGKWTLKY